MLNPLKQFENYLKYENNVSPHTLRNYMSDLTQFIKFLKHEKKIKDLNKVTNLTVRAYLGTLHKKNMRSSIARKLASIRHFLQYLTKEKKIKFDASELVSTTKQAKTLPEVLSVDGLY
jgi:integrase/recombinase XerC